MASLRRYSAGPPATPSLNSLAASSTLSLRFGAVRKPASASRSIFILTPYKNQGRGWVPLLSMWTGSGKSFPRTTGRSGRSVSDGSDLCRTRTGSGLESHTEEVASGGGKVALTVDEDGIALVHRGFELELPRAIEPHRDPFARLSREDGDTADQTDSDSTPGLHVIGGLHTDVESILVLHVLGHYSGSLQCLELVPSRESIAVAGRFAQRCGLTHSADLSRTAELLSASLGGFLDLVIGRLIILSLTGIGLDQQLGDTSRVLDARERFLDNRGDVLTAGLLRLLSLQLSDMSLELLILATKTLDLRLGFSQPAGLILEGFMLRSLNGDGRHIVLLILSTSRGLGSLK